jgi:hypothetical protein
MTGVVRVVGRLGRRRAKLSRTHAERLHFSILTPEDEWVHCRLDGPEARDLAPRLTGRTPVSVLGRVVQLDRGTFCRVRSITVLAPGPSEVDFVDGQTGKSAQ